MEIIGNNENAFVVLKVTTYATRDEIIDACETQSFEIEPEIAENAQSKLLNSKQRLNDFLRWYSDLPMNTQKNLLDSEYIWTSSRFEHYPLSLANYYINKIPRASIPSLKKYLLEFNSYVDMIDTEYIESILENQEKSNRLPIPSTIDIKQEVANYKKECGNHILSRLSKITDISVLRSLILEMLKACDFEYGIPSECIIKCFEAYEMAVMNKIDSFAADTEKDASNGIFSNLIDDQSISNTSSIAYCIWLLDPLQTYYQKCLNDKDAYSQLKKLIKDILETLIEEEEDYETASSIVSAMESINPSTSEFKDFINNMKYLRIEYFLKTWTDLKKEYHAKIKTYQELVDFLEAQIIHQLRPLIKDLPVSENFEAAKDFNKIGDVFFFSIRSFAIEIANNEHDYQKSLSITTLLCTCYSTSSWCYLTLKKDKEILNTNLNITYNDNILGCFDKAKGVLYGAIGLIILIGGLIITCSQ